MTKPLQDALERHEAGTDVPASFVPYSIIPHREGFMKKLGYFFAGVVAGVTALTVVAIMVDSIADNLEAPSDFDENSDDTGDNGCADDINATGEPVNSAM